MTLRKAQCFRAIFTLNFLKNTLFQKNIEIFRNYHVIKRICNIFSFHTVFMKLIVCLKPKARGYETYNSFHKNRMK